MGGSLVSDAAVTAVVRREYDAYGIDVIPAAPAVDALDEACTIFTRMWTEQEPFDFDGQHYQLSGAVCEPKPVQRPHPPILIGAGGEHAALRVVARHANIWNCPARTVEELRHKSSVLDEHCAAIGRNPSDIARSMQVLVDPTDPSSARNLLLELIDAGATHLVLAPLPPWPSAPAHWLDEKVVQPVLAGL